jgi:DNA-binding transcriptional LysR family regulator
MAEKLIFDILDINQRHTMKYDLNLLRVFDAVMEERNVTAAVGRLSLSQSAVSAALARLRDLFGDELFIRARYGVVPTEQAIAVAPMVSEAIRQLDQVVLEATIFDPATAQRTFTIAASGYFECVVIPQLMAQASQSAPQISMSVQPLTPELEATELATGQLNLALGRFVDPPENLVVSELFEDRFMCMVRREDAPKAKALSRKQFQAMRHVVVSPPGRWRTGLFQQLAKAGLSRTVLLRVSHFLAAPLAVARSGGCATLPQRIAMLFAEDARFRLVEASADLGTFPMQMAWHPRHRRDPGHEWLRGLIQSVCKGF